MALKVWEYPYPYASPTGRRAQQIQRRQLLLVERRVAGRPLKRLPKFYDGIEFRQVTIDHVSVWLGTLVGATIGLVVWACWPLTKDRDANASDSAPEPKRA